MGDGSSSADAHMRRDAPDALTVFIPVNVLSARLEALSISGRTAPLNHGQVPLTSRTPKCSPKFLQER